MDYCQYCLPARRRWHWDLHADYYLEKIRRFFFFWPAPRGDWLWGKILEFLALFRLVEFVKDPPPSLIFNRSLIVFAEAKKRGIDIEAIKILGSFKNEYRFRLPGPPTGGWRYFEANPLAETVNSRVVDDKHKFKSLMQAHGIPVPEGKMFTRLRRAMAYAKQLGFPLVVKPVAGSLGYHSAYQIENYAALDQAIRIAKTFRPDIIVERYTAGENFRVTVIGQKHVFVLGKDRSNVVGDGVSNVDQLIDKKNSDPRRGFYGQKNTTLHQISKSHPQFRGNLRHVPAAGEKVYLFDEFLPGSGIDFISIENIHPDNMELFLKAARALNTDLVGFDLIAENMTAPYYQQKLVFLEANTIPYIDLHQFPSHGQPAPIAQIVWDTVLEKK